MPELLNVALGERLTVPLPLGDFEALGQEEGVRETDDVPQRVGLAEGLKVGVPLRHKVMLPLFV